MAKKKVELEVNATDNASRTMGQVAESVKKIDNEAGKTKQGLSSLGQTALTAASTGKINFEGLAASLVGIVPIAGAAAAAIAAIGAASGAAKDWFLIVDQFSDITGVGMEASSVFATGIEMAGASVQRVGTSFAMLNQRLDDEARAATAAGAATGKFGNQLARLEEDHAQRVGDAAESLAERLGDLGEQRVDAARDVTRKIADFERDSSRKVAGYERDIYMMRRDYDLSRLDRMREIADQFAEIDGESADERAAIESQFANADTELGKRALAAELAALSGRTQARKDAITTDEQRRAEIAEREYNAREQAVREQIAMEREALQERIALEREANAERVAAFDKAQTRMEAAAEKASAREAKQYARQMQDLAAAGAAAASATTDAVNSTSAAMQRLGIDMDKYNRSTPLEKYVMLVDALNNVGVANDDLQRNMTQNAWPDSMKQAMILSQGETEKSKAAMDLFGRFSAGEWLDNIRIVEKEGWGGLTAAAEKYNRTIGPDHAKATQQFIDNEKKRELAAGGTAISIGQYWQSLVQGIETGDWTRQNELSKKLNEDIFGWAPGKYTPQQFMEKRKAAEESIIPGLPGNGRAWGGPVESGMPYIVGERGPELFTPRQGGTITNTWNYSPTYGAGPTNEPQSSFALMRAMAGV